MNHDIFFDMVRKTLFRGRLTQGAVDGINAIIAEFDSYHEGTGNIEHLAYILATAYHETAGTMQSIEEYGDVKRNRYYPYHGRGFVQLTWKHNYSRMGDLLNIDLEGQPELALSTDISAKIIIVGMSQGMFRGKKLSDFDFAQSDDVIAARAIVNADTNYRSAVMGKTIGQLVANYYYRWLEAINAASVGQPHPAATEPSEGKPAIKSRTIQSAIAGAIAFALVQYGIEIDEGTKAAIETAIVIIMTIATSYYRSVAKEGITKWI